MLALLSLPSAGTGGGGMGGSTCPPALAWNRSYPLRFSSFTAGSGGTVTMGTGADSGTHYLVTTDASTPLSSGANTMTLNNFTTSPISGSISVNGSTIIYVSGRLNANANQPAGNYSGSFNVIVNYH